MQFRLRTLFLLTAAVCVFCGVINAPPFIAIPLFFAAVWITPAYWVAGVIYGREGWRAFFIGGLASGAAPFLVLTLYTVSMGMWGWRFSDWSINDFGGIYGQYQLTNLIASLFIFAPVVLAFIGGWLSMWVYYGLKTPSPQPKLQSPFLPSHHPASVPQPSFSTESKPDIVTRS
jgi:hypothetical protein